MAIFEACVDSYESAKAAYLGGADRIELCGCLPVGGVTPSIALFDAIRRVFPIPIRVLIRPRGGDFLYSEAELYQMQMEVALFRDLGADGLVFGALTKEGDLDSAALQVLIAQADGASVTLHRAFDMCRYPLEALKLAQKLGFNAILTSGQMPSALEGAPLLGELYSLAEGKVEIMAGGGVNSGNILKIFNKTGVTSYHASCKRAVQSQMLFQKSDISMGVKGGDEYSRFVADEREVAACSKVVHSL